MLGGLAAAYFNAKGFHTEVGLMVSQLLQRVKSDKETVDLFRYMCGGRVYVHIRHNMSIIRNDRYMYQKMYVYIHTVCGIR